MEKIDTDWKTTRLKRLAKLFKPCNRNWAPLTSRPRCPLLLQCASAPGCSSVSLWSVSVLTSRWFGAPIMKEKTTRLNQPTPPQLATVVEFVKNLIYVIHCLRCHKQYIGETKRRLKDRFNEQRRPVDRPTPSSTPTAVSDHFLSDHHSPNDIGLIPLELIHSSRDAIRKAREAYFIERGQTLEPKHEEI